MKMVRIWRWLFVFEWDRTTCFLLGILVGIILSVALVFGVVAFRAYQDLQPKEAFSIST